MLLIYKSESTVACLASNIRFLVL